MLKNAESKFRRLASKFSPDEKIEAEKRLKLYKNKIKDFESFAHVSLTFEQGFV